MTSSEIPWLRRAGRGRAPDRSMVLWSLAEGERGRRWRWSLTDPAGAIRHVGLIELDRAWILERLELHSSNGIVTFHPAGDGKTAHGNVVMRHGVRPIEVGWTAGSRIGIAGDPFGTTLGAISAAGTDLAGHEWTLLTSLELQPMAIAPGLGVDARGVPVLDDPVEWPLERT